MPPSQSLLSYKDERRLSEAEALVPKLEVDIAQLDLILSDASLYSRDSALFHKSSQMAVSLRAKLAKAEEDWLELSELKESLGKTA
jgi:ABC transport system ATP-binding/permease protein